MAGYNLQARIGKLQELEARGVIKPEHQAELDHYRQQGIVKGAPAQPGERVKTTPEDMRMLSEASGKAAAERDALRTYSGASDAVRDMDTGPMRSWWLDAITPEEDGGVMDAVGAFVGAPFRALVSPKTWAARDHLKTVNANVALAGSQQMKGSSSDKDTALMRLSGIGPSKTVAENNRIVKEATYQSGLSQARALITQSWIARFGSVNNPASNGMTFEQALQRGEQRYADGMQRRKAARRLPKAPPRRPASPVTIDINGNPVQ